MDKIQYVYIIINHIIGIAIPIIYILINHIMGIAVLIIYISLLTISLITLICIQWSIKHCYISIRTNFTFLIKLQWEFKMKMCVCNIIIHCHYTYNGFIFIVLFAFRSSGGLRRQLGRLNFTASPAVSMTRACLVQAPTAAAVLPMGG